MDIRRLTRDDGSAFRDLRLAGLEAHPDAFGASWEEEAGRPVSWFENGLDGGYVAGCEHGGVLVGVAGLRRDDGIKTRHRGALWGMYVAPEARGGGVGSALVRQVIAEARGNIEELNLTVAAHNEPAVRLYRRLGFVAFGIQPHALKVRGAYVDEIPMRLLL